MTMKNPPLGLQRVRIVALAVNNETRANEFYHKTLGLEPYVEDGATLGYELGETILMLKPKSDWYGKPTQELNARITVEVENSSETEKALHALGVPVSDPVTDYDGHYLGSFLDTEGNKIWFCSMNG